jgi:hypothetical protein
MQKENQKKTEITQKSIDDGILITCSPATAPEKRAC